MTAEWRAVETVTSFTMLRCDSGAGEMARLVECLPCKNKDLSLMHRTHRKSQALRHILVIPAL